MSNHQGQNILPTATARGLAFVDTVVFYPLAYDAINFMDDDNLVTALPAQIQISTSLIGTGRKLSVNP